MNNTIPENYKTLNPLAISFVGKDTFDLDDENDGVNGIIDNISEIVTDFFSSQNKYNVKNYQNDFVISTFSNLTFDRVQDNYLGSEDNLVDISSMGGLIIDIVMKDEASKDHIFEIDLGRSSISIEKLKSFVITTGIESEGDELIQTEFAPA